MRRFIVAISIIAALIAGVFVIDHVRVGRPVSAALAVDSRNSVLTLRARQQGHLLPSTLVLDLRRVGADAAPVDLLRAVFQSAEALHERERYFNRVVLARSGEPVYVLDGSDFREMGVEYAVGENPIYMTRKFPSKLHLPDGSAAFGEWTGGWLGVLAEEMDDVNEAVAVWVGAEYDR